MRIDCNPRAMEFDFYADTLDEYYTLKLIYDNQNKIKTNDISIELIKKLFKFTIEGRKVTADEFIAYYNGRIEKLILNSCYGKLAKPERKFITVHKHDKPHIKATIFIDAIQSIAQREDGCASIKTSTCNYDTCDKYDKIIRQLS